MPTNTLLGRLGAIRFITRDECIWKPCVLVLLSCFGNLLCQEGTSIKTYGILLSSLINIRSTNLHLSTAQG